MQKLTHVPLAIAILLAVLVVSNSSVFKVISVDVILLRSAAALI